MIIKTCTLEDVPWLEANVRKFYTDWVVKNPNVTEVITTILLDERFFWIKTDKASLFCEHKGGEVEIPVFFGAIWEVLQLFRVAIKWAAERGAQIVSFSSSTGYNVAPIAKRLGIKKSCVVYIKDDL